MYSIGGVSVGLQAGGSSTDFVLLIMSKKAMNALLNGETKMGTDATAAAGPSGATAASAGTDILTYGRSKGLFAGVSLGGATLKPDDDANKRLYGKETAAREILVGNAVQTPSAAEDLVTLLKTKVPKRSAS
jgi:lipid-binding SYLF domain-containing protein